MTTMVNDDIALDQIVSVGSGNVGVMPQPPPLPPPQQQQLVPPQMSSRKPLLSTKSSPSFAMNSVTNNNVVTNGGGGSNGNSSTVVSFHQAVLSAMKLSRSSSFHHGNRSQLIIGGSNCSTGSEAPQPPSLSAGPTPELKPKNKMKERTKVALKLYIIHQKVLALQTMVKELYDLTEMCREAQDSLDRSNGNSSGIQRHHLSALAGVVVGEKGFLEQSQEDFLRKVIEIETEVRLLKKLVLFLCKHRIIEKHFG
jgi:hypothetical protein